MAVAPISPFRFGAGHCCGVMCISLQRNIAGLCVLGIVMICMGMPSSPHSPASLFAPNSSTPYRSLERSFPLCKGRVIARALRQQRDHKGVSLPDSSTGAYGFSRAHSQHIVQISLAHLCQASENRPTTRTQLLRFQKGFPGPTSLQGSGSSRGYGVHLTILYDIGNSGLSCALGGGGW